MKGVDMLWFRRKRKTPDEWTVYVNSLEPELRYAARCLWKRDPAIALWADMKLCDIELGLYPITQNIVVVPVGLHVVLIMVGGQSTADWRLKLDALAHRLQVRSIKIVSCEQSVIVLELRLYDTLAEPIPVPFHGYPDLKRVPIGRREDASTCYIPVLSRNVLIAGVPGSGKSGVLWSILFALAPAIHAGFVEVHMIDLKGGVEFAIGEDLFATFATNIPEAKELFADLELIMEGRKGSMRDIHARDHIPTVNEPMHLVIIDEAAAIAAYLPDLTTKKQFNSWINILLSQGRALGVPAIVSVQDASMEVIQWRQLIQVRIAMRMAERSQVRMVLNSSDDVEYIPDSLPGVGYVAIDETERIGRFRAYNVTDSDIHEVTNYYGSKK